MNNLPAFPHSHIVYSGGQPSYSDSDYADGMTLRDYFAAKVMHALISSPRFIQGEADFTKRQIAEDAYEMADAMLQKRNE